MFTKISTELLQLITIDQAWHYSIVPKESKNDHIVFYIDQNAPQHETQEELEILLGKGISFEPINGETINQVLSKYYRKGNRSLAKQSSNPLKSSDDFLVNLITEANSNGSSDIHLEAYEEKCRVRMRIDGKLVERYVLEREVYPAIINKIKIKANLDIAEKRLPQDGRIFFTSGATKFDIRVSILPTLHGEKIVLRLLSKDATKIDLSTLGLNPDQLSNYLEGIRKPNGIVLISGPTGSGKTTTLYATLKILNKESFNILTIEDPIEYTLDGINQVQLKESIGLTFASALRTFLRQDPDIIMLGEIRDGETAQMAIRAALTGHLVLSTIHTNSAWGTISRLIDMGVPPFLVANTLNLSVAQRLVRLLCADCKKEESFDTNLFPKTFRTNLDIKTHFVACGCEKCYYTGYHGRKAVYEVIPIDFELSHAIKTNTFDVSSLLAEKKMESLSQAAINLFVEGSTTIEEIYPILMNQ